MSLIDELGSDYFNDMCRDALVLKDDTVYRVISTGRGNRVEAFKYVKSEDGRIDLEREHLERDFFTGWKVFSYPTLGYRRLGKHLIGHIQRRQSTRRGLRTESMNVTLSPCSALVANLNVEEPPNAHVRALAAMKPQFDDYEESLPRLLAGEQMGIVLSDNIIIEPLVENAKAQGFGIYMRQHVIGTMNGDGVIAWERSELASTLDPFKRDGTNG